MAAARPPHGLTIADGYDERRGTAGSAFCLGPVAPPRLRHRAARAGAPAGVRRCTAGPGAGLGALLPLLLATLHEELERPLVCLLPEDADARDAADAAGWFIGAENVALLPSRGVHWGSGLEPPPHLVGERARALDVLARGGLVCASAAALAEGMPPPSDRPEPIRLEVGTEPGIEALAEDLALAGYERVERAEERGQFAVRGGILDVFPTTGREPLRIEFFGDEIEQVRVFSPFTQRALHPVTDAVVYPAAERIADRLSDSLLLDEGETPPVPDDLVSVSQALPTSCGSRTRSRASGRRKGCSPSP